MQLGGLFLPAGLVFLLVNPPWFSGQHTLGLVLTILGAVPLAIFLIGAVIVGAAAAKGKL